MTLGDTPLPVLLGAVTNGNVPLAALLLAAGANPNDAESLYHAVEVGDVNAVELLIAHGATARGTNPLLRAIDRHDAALVARLLAHDALPDEVGAAAPALHHAAVRAAPRGVAELLLAAGADPTRVWEGRDAYAAARVLGAVGVAEALAAAGLARPLTGDEAALAALHEPVGAEAPSRIEWSTLSDSDRLLTHRLAARSGAAPSLRRVLSAGWDPAIVDEAGMTALHVALWEGFPEQVAELLSVPHDLAHRNGYGGDAW